MKTEMGRCGYVVDSKTRRQVHVAVYKAHHGSLHRGWCVRHIDGDRWNNSIENLVAIPIAIWRDIRKWDHKNLVRELENWIKR